MLDSFFNPKSVAVIGAAREKEKLGRIVFDNILKYGFKGSVYPVNPNAREVAGYKCFDSILDIKDGVDLSIIIVPAKVVPQVLKECGEKGISSVIIISAGFREVGDEGKKIEDEIKALSERYGIRILGPNCLGIIDTLTKLNASFAAEMPKNSKISILTQSGALGTALLDWLIESRIGVARFISLGNKSDLCEIDFLKYLKDDKETEVIFAYLEAISDGKEFIKITRELTAKKPLVLLKAGVTDIGAKAASSHTASLAGSEEALEAVCRQNGIIRTQNTQEFFDLFGLFAANHSVPGSRIAVVTNAGGPGVLAADSIGKSKLNLAELRPKTLKILKESLPPAASILNPIDLIGDAKADRYERALSAVTSDPNVDGVLVLLTPQAMTEVDTTAQIISIFKKSSKKPIVTCFMGGELVKSGIEILEKHKVAYFATPERAIKTLELSVNYTKYLDRPKDKLPKISVDRFFALGIFGKIRGTLEKSQSKGLIDPGLASDMLEAYKIPAVKPMIVHSVDEAAKAAFGIGYPVVLKIVSPNIVHKAAVGGVKTGILNDEQTKQAFKEIMSSVKLNEPKAEIRGIAVYPVVKGEVEVILGAKHDSNFGHLIMFGLGGIFVEVLKDVSFRVAPLSKEDAKEMISETRASKILKGRYGKKSYDKEALIDVIMRLSELTRDFPQIKELDLNPLKVGLKGEGVMALDVKMVI